MIQSKYSLKDIKGYKIYRLKINKLKYTKTKLNNITTNFNINKKL